MGDGEGLKGYNYRLGRQGVWVEGSFFVCVCGPGLRFLGFRFRSARIWFSVCSWKTHTSRASCVDLFEGLQ